MKKVLLALTTAIMLAGCATQSQFEPRGIVATEHVNKATDYYVQTAKGSVVFLATSIKGRTLAENLIAYEGEVVCFNEMYSTLSQGPCKRGLVKRR